MDWSIGSFPWRRRKSWEVSPTSSLNQWRRSSATVTCGFRSSLDRCEAISLASNESPAASPCCSARWSPTPCSIGKTLKPPGTKPVSWWRSALWNSLWPNCGLVSSARWSCFRWISSLSRSFEKRSTANERWSLISCERRSVGRNRQKPMNSSKRPLGECSMSDARRAISPAMGGFRFFSKAKYRLTHSRTLEDEEVERIAAIPSFEDKTRTLPHWIIYIAWSRKFFSLSRRCVMNLSRLSSGSAQYGHVFVLHHSLFAGMGSETSKRMVGHHALVLRSIDSRHRSAESLSHHGSH